MKTRAREGEQEFERMEEVFENAERGWWKQNINEGTGVREKERNMDRIYNIKL